MLDTPFIITIISMIMNVILAATTTALVSATAWPFFLRKEESIIGI